MSFRKLSSPEALLVARGIDGYCNTVWNLVGFPCQVIVEVPLKLVSSAKFISVSSQTIGDVDNLRKIRAQLQKIGLRMQYFTQPKRESFFMIKHMTNINHRGKSTYWSAGHRPFINHPLCRGKYPYRCRAW